VISFLQPQELPKSLSEMKIPQDPSQSQKIAAMPGGGREEGNRMLTGRK
jgi:hypothetical protein